jgi:hypothetical protein
VKKERFDFSNPVRRLSLEQQWPLIQSANSTGKVDAQEG